MRVEAQLRLRKWRRCPAVAVKSVDGARLIKARESIKCLGVARRARKAAGSANRVELDLASLMYDRIMRLPTICARDSVSAHSGITSVNIGAFAPRSTRTTFSFGASLFVVNHNVLPMPSIRPQSCSNPLTKGCAFQVGFLISGMMCSSYFSSVPDDVVITAHLPSCVTCALCPYSGLPGVA